MYHLKMGQNTQANLLDMDLGFPLAKMDQSMKETGNITQNQALEKWYSQMDQFMMVTGSMINFMAMES